MKAKWQISYSWQREGKTEVSKAGTKFSKEVSFISSEYSPTNLPSTNEPELNKDNHASFNFASGHFAL